MSVKSLKTKSEREQYLFLDKREGAVIPIFIEDEDGKYHFEYNALLLSEDPPKWREHTEPEPFINYTENVSINIIKRRWNVQVKSDNPFDDGKVLTRWVPEFHSKFVGIIKIENRNPKLNE